MRTFKQFITESDDDLAEQAKDHARDIFETCGSFLRDTHFVKNQSKKSATEFEVFWRGFNDKRVGTGESVGFLELRPQKNRRPMSSSFAFHFMLDDYLNEKFGQKYRSNAVFATADYHGATMYGSANICFFADGYSFAYSPKFVDAWEALDNYGHPLEEIVEKAEESTGEKVERDEDGDIDMDSWVKILAKYLRKSNYYTDTGLDAALHVFKHHEVMFACKDYFLVDPETKLGELIIKELFVLLTK